MQRLIHPKTTFRNTLPSSPTGPKNQQIYWAAALILSAPLIDGAFLQCHDKLLNRHVGSAKLIVCVRGPDRRFRHPDFLPGRQKLVQTVNNQRIHLVWHVV